MDKKVRTRQRKKKFNDYNIILKDMDFETLVALYKHRFLTVDMLYKLVVQNKRQIHLVSFRARLYKLALKGYLEGKLLSRATLGKKENENVNEKAYSLTEKGVLVVIDFLGIDSVQHDGEGIFYREYQTADELRVNDGQLQHHFLTQEIAINALFYIEAKGYTKFYNHEYGNGDKYCLRYTDGKERKIFPDWLLVKRDPNNFESPKLLSLEADRRTMNYKQLERKFISYLHYVSHNAETYRDTPLHLIIAVENGAKRRISTIIQNAFLTFEDALYENTIRVYVLSDQEAAVLMADLYTEESVEFDSLNDIESVITSVVSRSVGYTLRERLMGYQSLDKNRFLTTPSGELVYSKANADTLRFVCLNMTKGSVNDQASAYHYKQVMLQEEGNHRSFVLGIYQSKDELMDEMFLDTKTRHKQTVQLGKSVLLSTYEDLQEGFVYQIDKNDNNTQIIRKVRLEDVLL